MDDILERNIDWVEDCLMAEIKVMRSVRHPNLIRSIEVYRTANQVAIFMPFAGGGTVTKVMEGRQGKGLGEEQARLWFRMLANAVFYLHCNG